MIFPVTEMKHSVLKIKNNNNIINNLYTVKARYSEPRYSEQ